MQNANYYLEQVNLWKKKLEEAKIEKSNYELLIVKLKELLDGLPDAQQDFCDAENCFKNGGYVDNHGTYDKGKLDECASSISEAIENLNKLISDTSDKIDMLGDSIIRFRNNYNSAYSNYRRALSSETGA